MRLKGLRLQSHELQHSCTTGASYSSLSEAFLNGRRLHWEHVKDVDHVCLRDVTAHSANSTTSRQCDSSPCLPFNVARNAHTLALQITQFMRSPCCSSAAAWPQGGGWSWRDPARHWTDVRAPGWGSVGCRVWRGTAAPVPASHQDSWAKAAGQWETLRDWPERGAGRSWSLETRNCLVLMLYWKLSAKQLCYPLVGLCCLGLCRCFFVSFLLFFNVKRLWAFGKNIIIIINLFKLFSKIIKMRVNTDKINVTFIFFNRLYVTRAWSIMLLYSWVYK